MSNQNTITLYIHLPWCIKKCPYCDFNSHALKKELPEAAYIDCLIADFETHLPKIQDRTLTSIFFGGGTPSLFSATSLKRLLDHVKDRLVCSDTLEVTLEANPGTVEQARFEGYFHAGINRISLGIQSFQDDKLKMLGRIHDSTEAGRAIETAKNAGFSNFNIDIMHGLPNQTCEDALFDLEKALSFQPTHLSWYQLTIEPNTYFHKHTPRLPNEAMLFDIEQAGFSLLHDAGFERYEVSAFARKDKRSQHNLNYWHFGDYLGIGAGAHSKLTQNHDITRHWNFKTPATYMDPAKPFHSKTQPLNEKDRVFEFMMNTLRLNQAIPFSLFESRTFLNREILDESLTKAHTAGLLLVSDTHFETTPLGKKFLNDLLQIFL